MPGDHGEGDRAEQLAEHALYRHQPPGDEGVEQVDDDMVAPPADARQHGEDHQGHQQLGHLDHARHRTVEQVAADDIDEAHRHQGEQGQRRDEVTDPLEPAQ
ncbi:MAG: hypothetical protein R3E48_04750 [Burkholderiaceae bacterium]